MIYHASMDDISSKLLYGCLETLVLAVLAREPLHGYALKWNLTEKSKYHIQPGFERLYRLLATLERRGWIAGNIEPAGRSRVRKVYAITSRGRKRLAFSDPPMERISISGQHVPETFRLTSQAIHKRRSFDISPGDISANYFAACPSNLFPDFISASRFLSRPPPA